MKRTLYNSKQNTKISMINTIMKPNQEQILGIVRHALTCVGGILIMYGISDSEMITEVIGSVMALTATIWSIVSKNK